MRRANQLHAALRNCARSQRLLFAPDLVNHNRLGVVVLHRFNHHLMLARRVGHLHAPRPPHRRMRNVAVAANLVGGVHHHHAPALGQHTRRFAQHGGLAHARPPQQQNAFAREHQVFNNLRRAIHRAPHAARQPDDFSLPVANGRDAVQRALDAGTVVRIKLAQAGHHCLNVCDGQLGFCKLHLAAQVTRCRHAPHIHHHL